MLISEFSSNVFYLHFYDVHLELNLRLSSTAVIFLLQYIFQFLLSYLFIVFFAVIFTFIDYKN